MTITFSVGLLFKMMTLAITTPLFVLAYIQGWRYFFCKKYRDERVFGVLFWAGAALALFITYMVLTTSRPDFHHFMTEH